MRGAPWDGLFYGFVLLTILLTGSLACALNVQDFLFRTIAWALVVLSLTGMVRIIRRAYRMDPPDRPTGRWWYGG